MHWGRIEGTVCSLIKSVVFFFCFDFLQKKLVKFEICTRKKKKIQKMVCQKMFLLVITVYSQGNFFYLNTILVSKV